MNKKILVCDDDESIIDVITVILRERGWSVITKREEITVDDIARENPGVILMDLWMPGMGGEELTKRLKQDTRTKHIPLIIVSAHNNAMNVAQRIGADDVLLKPFDIETLEHLVERWGNIPHQHSDLQKTLQENSDTKA